LGLGWILALLCAKPDLFLRRIDPGPPTSHDRHVFDPASSDEFAPLAHHGRVDIPSLLAAVCGSDLVLRVKRVEHFAIVGLPNPGNNVFSDTLLPTGCPILHLSVEAVQELPRPDFVPQE
jgi:hypothetical protein